MNRALGFDEMQWKQQQEWRYPEIFFCLTADCEQPWRQAWCGASDFQIYELDLTQTKPVRYPFAGDGHQSYVTGLVDLGPQLVSASYDQKLIWWDKASRRQTRSIEAHQRWIRDLIAIPNRPWLASVADDMVCRIWNRDNGEVVAELQGHEAMTPHHYPSMLYAVTASPDGRYLATGDRVGHVVVWDLDRFERAAELETPVMYTWDPKARRHSIGGIRSLAFSPQGSQLAVGGIGKIGNIDHLGGPARLEVFDWQSRQRVHEIEDNQKKGLVEQIIWDPDRDWIMTVGGDHNGFISVFSSSTGERVSQAGHAGHIHALVHNDDCTSLLIAAHERITRWDLTQAT